jgi:hypothetical protein
LSHHFLFLNLIDNIMNWSESSFFLIFSSFLMASPQPVMEVFISTLFFICFFFKDRVWLFAQAGLEFSLLL